MITRPSSSKIRAGRSWVHSGHNDCVVLGRPLRKGSMRDPEYVVSGCITLKSAMFAIVGSGFGIDDPQGLNCVFQRSYGEYWGANG
jgi:hypothetical protein